MRNLITDYSFTPETRVITLDKFSSLGVENVRLIVNETQKFVICSSMLKANITIEGNKITYTDTLPALEWDDVLTIEVDMGTDVVYMGGTDWIINAKRDAVENGVDAQELIITREMGEYLRPLAEGGSSAVGSYLLCGALANCATTKADLSSWSMIRAYYTCYQMFYKNAQLYEVDLTSLQSVVGENSAYGMFNLCTSLRIVKMSNLRTISGAMAMSNMFSGCASLKKIDLSKLENVIGSNCANGAFRDCIMLESVDLRRLIVQNVNNNIWLDAFTNTPRLRTMYINCAALIRVANLNQTPLGRATGITDLYLYGDATNDIYLTWQGNLNFNSVCGILAKLCENTDANGLSCNFISGFAIADKTEYTYIDGDGNETHYENEMGVLTALREQATNQGWTITNLQIN